MAKVYKIEASIFVKANRDQISQVVMSFIDNAIKYCDRKIEINLLRSVSQVIFEISNDKKIIASDDTDLIFDRFYKVLILLLYVNIIVLTLAIKFVKYEFHNSEK